MARQFHAPEDPIAGERIREVLALGAPEEPEKLDLPKPTRMELLQTWKLKAAEAHSRAHRRAKIEAKWMQPRPPRHLLEEF